MRLFIITGVLIILGCDINHSHEHVHIYENDSKDVSEEYYDPPKLEYINDIILGYNLRGYKHKQEYQLIHLEPVCYEKVPNGVMSALMLKVIKEDGKYIYKVKALYPKEMPDKYKKGIKSVSVCFNKDCLDKYQSRANVKDKLHIKDDNDLEIDKYIIIEYNEKGPPFEYKSKQYDKEYRIKRNQLIDIVIENGYNCVQHFGPDRICRVGSAGPII
jgi:hypothetical protein